MEPLPHDLELERAAIAAILLDPSLAVEAVDLTPTSFYSEKHRSIFRALVATLAANKDTNGKPTADLHLLARTMREANTLDAAGGPSYLMQLMDGYARSHNVTAYVKALLELEAKRDAVLGAVEIAAVARREHVEDVRAVLEQVAKRIKSRETTELRSLDLRKILDGDDEPIPWLVEGWIGSGDLTFLAGEWGTGKSLVGLDLAISVAAAIPWLGRAVVARGGPVLVVDEENNPRNATRRLRRMLRGRNLAPDLAAELPLHYLHGNGVNLDTRTGRALLAREIARTKPVLIILDSLIRFHRRDENKNSAMSAFFEDSLRPITRDGIAILALDHMRKPGEHDKDADVAHRMRGSGDKAGVADTLWTLEGNRDEPTRTLSCRKIRWEDSLPPSVSTKWVVSEDETAAWIEASDATLNAEVAVLAVLNEAGPQGIFATQLFDEVEKRGIPRRTAVRTVKRMRFANAIEFRQEPRKRIRYWARGIILTIPLV